MRRLLLPGVGAMPARLSGGRGVVASVGGVPAPGVVV